MSYRISKIKLRNFRNYGCFDLDVISPMLIIIGENAIGKTNIIEALQLLTMLESFRRPQVEELVQWEKDSASLLLEALDDKREYELECRVEDGKKRFYLNGKHRFVKDLKGNIPATLFTPDDLENIKGSAERRRDALDSIGMQISPVYLSLKSDYERVVRQRNAILKEDFVQEEVLEVWTSSLLSLGTLLVNKRKNLLEIIKQYFIEIYASLSPKDKVDLVYIPSWDLREHSYAPEEAFQKMLEDVKQEERARRISVLGPHKDEILVVLNGKNARVYASQGQQRLLVLALKLAELETLEQFTGKRPVLLLDDVMSELDAEHRAFFLSFIKGRTQTFITTTNREYFSQDILEDAQVLDLHFPIGGVDNE